MKAGLNGGFNSMATMGDRMVDANGVLTLPYGTLW